MRSRDSGDPVIWSESGGLEVNESAGRMALPFLIWADVGERTRSGV